MKNRILLMLLSVCFLANGQIGDRCVIRGTIKNANSNSKIYLQKNGIKWDSSLAVNEQFELSTSLKNPSVWFIRFDSSGRGEDIKLIPLFLSKGIVNISIEFLTDSSKVEISGAPLSLEYEKKLLEPVLHYNREINRLRVLIQTTSKGDSSEIIKLNNEIAVVIAKCYGVPKNYVKAYPSSELCIEALKMMNNGDPTIKNPESELKELFNGLSDRIKNSQDGKEYAEWLNTFTSKTKSN